METKSSFPGKARERTRKEASVGFLPTGLVPGSKKYRSSLKHLGPESRRAC